MNRKAVSTAITSVMLLSLVMALTAGVYVVTTQGINAMTPASQAALAKGEEVAGQFSAAIEEGGLGVSPIVAGDYEYGNLADLILNIERSAAYVKDVPGYFRVILENPTDTVIQVPSVKLWVVEPDRVTELDLSHSEFTNLLVADRWGDANPIGFTPLEAGEHTMIARVFNSGGTKTHEKQVTFTVSAEPEVESSGSEDGEVSEGGGSSKFTVLELDTSTLGACEGTTVTANSCSQNNGPGTWSTSGKDSISVGTKKIAIGYALSSRTWCYHGTANALGFNAPYQGDDYTQEEYAEEEGYYAYVNPSASGCQGSASVKAVRWVANGRDTTVSMTSEMLNGNSLRVSGFDSENENLMRLTKNILAACDKTLATAIDYSGSFCTNCIDNLKSWSHESGASYAALNQESAIVDPNELTCVGDSTPTYAVKDTKMFTLPYQKIESATMYLIAYEDVSVKFKVNNNLLTEDWLDLPNGSPVELDITGKVLPGTLGNTLEMWIDPQVGIGEHTVNWMVMVE